MPLDSFPAGFRALVIGASGGIVAALVDALRPLLTPEQAGDARFTDLPLAEATTFSMDALEALVAGLLLRFAARFGGEEGDLVVRRVAKPEIRRQIDDLHIFWQVPHDRLRCRMRQGAEDELDLRQVQPVDRDQIGQI